MNNAIRKGIGLVIAILFAVFCPSALAAGFPAEEIYESVFVIETDGAIGSGFAISENDVITNAHVINGARTIRVVTYNGNEYRAVATAFDEDLDLALLNVKNTSFSPLVFDSLEEVRPGNDVYAIGAPKSMAYTLTKGIVSSKNRLIRGRQYIQIDAAVNEGNSGGPLLNAEGRVLGVITLKLADAEGIGLAIPITVVSDWLSGIEHGSSIVPEQEDSAPQENSSPALGPEDSSDLELPPVPDRATEKVNAMLVIALLISVLVNVVLIVLLIRKSKEEKPVTDQTHDRTDFEIEFED